MALNLYRRHGSHCTAKQSLHAMTYEADEHRRSGKSCVCPIYASGTLGGSFKRKNTERAEWPDAKQVATDWETAGSWAGSRPPQSAQQPPLGAAGVEHGSNRISIADAIAAFLAIREGSKIAPATVRKYKTFTKQLAAFADARGYVMLDQFTSADIDLFYGRWKLGPRAKGKALGMLRGFFTFCVNREWLSKSPVTRDLKPPLGASRVANKVPFTDDELTRIINACDQLPEITWSNGATNGKWAGDDTKDFIWLLAFTGLRISDAALFSMARLRGNEVFLRAKKNGGDVFTWIPDWLCARLVERSKHHGAAPFMVGKSERLDTVTDLWRRKINKVFELAGKFDEAPTPHRFRHTFARILLQRGVSLADVADLLGDNEKTIREHYARWVPERQARLTKILQDAFEDKPRPKVVAFPARTA
jgi:integrase